MLSSRNFTVNEIAHRPLPKDVLYELIACFQMGKMQSIVDYLSYKLRYEVSCEPTSGYRDPAYNKTIGGAENSRHCWKIQNGKIVCGGDYRFYNKITKVQIPCSVIYGLLRPFKGEIYHNQKQDIIHIADQDFDEPHFIK